MERFSQAEASIRTSFLSAFSFFQLTFCLSSCKLTDQNICLDVGIKTFHRKATMTQPFSNMSYLHWTRITRGTFVIWIYPPHLGFMWLICRSVSVEYTGISTGLCTDMTQRSISLCTERNSRGIYFISFIEAQKKLCVSVCLKAPLMLLRAHDWWHIHGADGHSYNHLIKTYTGEKRSVKTVLEVPQWLYHFILMILEEHH